VVAGSPWSSAEVVRSGVVGRCVVQWCSMVNWSGSVRRRLAIGGRASMVGLRVDRGTLIPNVSGVSGHVVGVVRHDLDPAVRQRYPVFSSDYSMVVLNLLLGEICSGVGVLNTELVGVGSGRDLVGVMVLGGGMVGRRRGVVQRGRGVVGPS